MPDNSKSEVRDCIVKLLDDHGVEHSVRVRAESVYEAGLRGLQRLNSVGWESDGQALKFANLRQRASDVSVKVQLNRRARLTIS